MTDIDVLITGAGPTGLTLAGELARRGVSFRIIDRAGEFFGGSRADGIQPRTMEVFADLGILPAILAGGHEDILLRAYQGGSVVWEGQMSAPVEPTPATPYPNIWFVPQFRIEEILRERLADFGVRVELRTRLTEFEQDQDGVTATLDRGGVAETVRARYLVGADGGGSTVRKRLGIAFPGETDEQTTMLFADARVDGIDRSHGRIWPVDGGRVSVTPLAGTELFVVVAAPPQDRDEPVLDHLRRQVITASGRDDILVREVTWHTTWRANTRLAECLREGRVFLAGDAGHVHPPTGGQGMNTGLQDGYNLGWKLAATLAGGSAALLDSYEPERMIAARTALAISTALLDKHKRGDADAHVRGPEVHGLALNYRGGALAHDDRAHPGAVRAGDRAPDAPVTTAEGEPVRLFELFHGTQWTLLGFGATTANAVATLAERCGPVVRGYTVLRPGETTDGPALTDHDGHAHTGYDVTEGTLALVRPDGYLGVVTGSSEQVGKYWNFLHGND